MLRQNTIKVARLKNLRNTEVNVPLGTLIPTHCTYFLFFFIPIFLCYMNISVD